MEGYEHRPVLLDEAVAALAVRPDGIYLDATFGRGGHAQAVLERLGPDGRLYAIDRDTEAVKAAQTKFAHDKRFTIVKGRFSMLGHYVQHWGIRGRVNGIVLDLGVSSPQLEDPSRGFSFRKRGPLDMRMDREAGISAGEWLNAAGEDEIARVVRELGEERFAKRIARAVVRARGERPIETTDQLAAIVAQAVPTREPGKDPATRTFQAIRMYVNQEIEELDAVLPQTLDALAPGGRLAVISFHSLEDRLVKNFIRDQARGDRFPPDLPVTQAQLAPRLETVGKAIKPGEDEVRRNPRARSAVLRIAERRADA